MKKKLLSLLLALLMALLCTSCATPAGRDEEDALIERAIDALTEYWRTERFSTNPGRSETGLLQIVHTRVVYIPEELDKASLDERQLSLSADLDGVHCVVEFILLTEYNTAPYTVNMGLHDTVAFYRDGRCEVLGVNPFLRFYQRFCDPAPLIASISDRGSEFDQTFHLLTP